MFAGKFRGLLVYIAFLGTNLLAASYPELLDARNRQDRAALEQIARTTASAAESNKSDAVAQFRLAEALSYLAEVSTELGDRETAKKAAETGIRAAREAVKLKPDSSEYHLQLGILCGQVIPGNKLLALRYGKCASDSVERAVKLDPKSSRAYIGRGVGNYYLPPVFGGSVDAAIRDFRKAIELDPKSADAYLWLGLALRKANRNSEARAAIAQSLRLNPNRLWAKQQLEKTPAQ